MWEIPVRRWAESANIKDQTENDLPKEKDDVHKPEYAPVLKIESPKENQTFAAGSDITVKFSSQGKYDLGQADLILQQQLPRLL